MVKQYVHVHTSTVGYIAVSNGHKAASLVQSINQISVLMYLQEC